MNAPSTTGNDPALAFGPFVLHPAHKLLLEDGRAVRVGSRAFELLVVLTDRAGTVVSRAELEAFVWPRSLVEETSLRVHMSALRRILGDGQNGARYIVNVPGRGYSFLADVSIVAPPSLAPSRAVSTIDHNLPTRLTREIGRQGIVAEIVTALGRQRLVSVVGPGGMGKTTVALAVAEAVMGRYPDGVCFVDLAPLADPALVPLALAAALNLGPVPANPLAALRAHLTDRRLLVVLDNCEHVIDATAVLVEDLLGMAPGMQILATSREPLAAEGEWVCRLAGLDTPLADITLDLQQARAFPAVQLFIERSQANAGGDVMTEENAALIGHLCRRLDGMPLAIELAAGCMNTLGPQGLADRLDQMFELLTRGRRNVPARHRTLQALLDWSYRLLSEPEQLVLSRISVFRGGFSIEAAAAVASCDRVTPVRVVECLIGLAAKSLVAKEAYGDEMRHRLLHTTRTYAAAHLAVSAEAETVARRHAEYMLAVLESARDRTGSLHSDLWNITHGHLMDDVRAALDWANGKDASMGGALTVAAYVPMCSNGRLDEYRKRVEQAISRMRLLDPPQPKRELQLYTVLTSIMGQTATDDALRARINARTIALAEQQHALIPKASAFYGTCQSAFGQGDYLAALHYAEQARELLADDAAASVLLGDRLMALSLHFLGRHAEAEVLIERVMTYPAVALPLVLSSHVPPRSCQAG